MFRHSGFFSGLPVGAISEALPTIDGIAIGHTGGNGTEYTGLDLTGFKLVAGDDFDSLPARWSPSDNPTGKYCTSNNVRGGYYNGSDPMVSCLVDPYWRGHRSANGDPLGIDRVTVDADGAVIHMSAPEVEISDFLPTDVTFDSADGEGKPVLLNGALQTMPHFMFSAKASFALIGRMYVPTGIADGHWACLWTTGRFYPDYGEIDLNEYRKNANGINGIGEFNVFTNEFNGGPRIKDAVAAPASPSNRWVTVAVVKDGETSISFYDDIAVEGTMALRGSTTTRVNRVRGAHEVRLQAMVDTDWDGGTFDIGNWPSYAKYDFWQAWVPTAAGANPALQVLTPVQTTPGGSWATTLPAAATISGGAAGVELMFGVFDWPDAPGAATKNTTTHLPGGMTIDAGTRAVTGTVPTTDGGRVIVAIVFAYDDGTPVKRVFQPFDVAPAAQSSLFANLNLEYTNALDQDILYTDFHSGNLGPHTYSISLTGGSWITVTGNGTGAVNLSGTAPSSDETVTVEITCTNAIGQTTVVERTIGVAEGAPPETLIFDDRFTDTNGTFLVFHTPTHLGTSWSHVSGDNSLLRIDSDNKVASSTTNNTQYAKIDDAVGANLRIEFDITYKSGTPNSTIGVYARATASTDAYIVLYRQATTEWVVRRRVGSANTDIVTLSRAPGNGVIENVKVEFTNVGSDVQIDVAFDDVPNATLSITDSSGSQITGSGDAGIFASKFATPAAQIDNLLVTQL